MLFGHDISLMDVAEDSTTSIGADLIELSDESLDVEHPHKEETEEHNQPLEETLEEGRPEEQDEEIEEKEVEETLEQHVESTHPFDRPSIKQLEEAFPGLMKKFPSLRDMYFREAEYSKI